jgi:histone H3/H4
VDCWDAHLPGARHRVAYAEERTAPRAGTSEEAAEGRSKARASKGGRRRVAPSKRRDPSLPQDSLIVVKHLKAYVRAASGMNTSDAVVAVLSEKVRDLCDRAVEKARASERKTVLDRDFDP